MSVKLFRGGPTDIERLVLLWETVKPRVVAEIELLKLESEKTLAKGVLDSVHMQLVSELVAQAHATAPKAKVTKTVQERTTVTTTT